MLSVLVPLVLAIAPITTGTEVSFVGGAGGFQYDHATFCPSAPNDCATTLGYTEVRTKTLDSGLTASLALGYAASKPLGVVAKGSASIREDLLRTREFGFGAIRLGYNSGSTYFDAGLLLPVPVPTIRVWQLLDERSYLHVAFAPWPIYFTRGLLYAGFGQKRDRWRYEVGASTFSTSSVVPALDVSADVEVISRLHAGLWGEAAVPDPKPLWTAGLNVTLDFPNATIRMKPDMQSPVIR